MLESISAISPTSRSKKHLVSERTKKTIQKFQESSSQDFIISSFRSNDTEVETLPSPGISIRRSLSQENVRRQINDMIEETTFELLVEPPPLTVANLQKYNSSKSHLDLNVDEPKVKCPKRFKDVIKHKKKNQSVTCFTPIKYLFNYLGIVKRKEIIEVNLDDYSSISTYSDRNDQERVSSSADNRLSRTESAYVGQNRRYSFHSHASMNSSYYSSASSSASSSAGSECDSIEDVALPFRLNQQISPKEKIETHGLKMGLSAESYDNIRKYLQVEDFVLADDDEDAVPIVEIPRNKSNSNSTTPRASFSSVDGNLSQNTQPMDDTEKTEFTVRQSSFRINNPHEIYRNGEANDIGVRSASFRLSDFKIEEHQTTSNEDIKKNRPALSLDAPAVMVIPLEENSPEEINQPQSPSSLNMKEIVVEEEEEPMKEPEGPKKNALTPALSRMGRSFMVQNLTIPRINSNYNNEEVEVTKAPGSPLSRPTSQPIMSNNKNHCQNVPRYHSTPEVSDTTARPSHVATLKNFFENNSFYGNGSIYQHPSFYDYPTNKSQYSKPNSNNYHYPNGLSSYDSVDMRTASNQSMPSGYSPRVSSQSSGQGFSYSSSQDTASINYSRIYDDKSFDSTYRPEALHNRVLEVFNQQKQPRDAYEITALGSKRRSKGILITEEEKTKRNSRERTLGKSKISFTQSTEDKEYAKDHQRALVPEAKSLSSSSSSSIQAPKKRLPSKNHKGGGANSPVVLNEKKLNQSHYTSSLHHRRQSSSSSNSLDENALRPQKLYSSFIQQRAPTVFISSASTASAAPLTSISTPQPSYEYLNI